MSMRVGMNLDLFYQGQTFHIQTEDSGNKNPIIVTHLFRSGHLLHTLTTSYQSLLDTHTFNDSDVRILMKNQHLKMIQDLE